MKEEIEIVKKAKNGDEKAFGKLYDEHMPRIYRFVLLRTGRKADAEDLTHQIFMNAWQNVNRYEFRGFPFSSWLYRIANNAVIDYYRTWKNNQPLETTAEEVLTESPNFDEQLDQQLNLKIVKAAINDLEQNQQNVLIMKFVDDLSNKEIAEALEKSEGAIRVIQHRALKQLKNIINNSQIKEV
ncbi:MAG: sigma-70 family RNA polymerase sigma factor [Patescibacteria group bacterium]|nr:sigma-70 family RNA polymerase sigma factor [Patescibacteria group bacterium]